MAVRSHVDPSTFVVFMHVTGDYLGEKLSSVVKSLQARHGDSFDPVLDELNFRTQQVLFHEGYHFWQGLRLPFLFRYATLTFRDTFLAFKQLSKLDRDFRNWDCVLPAFARLTLPACLGYKGSSL